jgi:hypothetical protein
MDHKSIFMQKIHKRSNKINKSYNPFFIRQEQPKLPFKGANIVNQLKPKVQKKNKAI